MCVIFLFFAVLQYITTRVVVKYRVQYTCIFFGAVFSKTILLLCVYYPEHNCFTVPNSKLNMQLALALFTVFFKAWGGPTFSGGRKSPRYFFAVSIRDFISSGGTVL